MGDNKNHKHTLFGRAKAAKVNVASRTSSLMDPRQQASSSSRPQKEAVWQKTKPIPNNMTTRRQKLPAELWLDIFSYLDYSTLCSLPRTCRYFKLILEDSNPVIDRLLFRNYPTTTAPPFYGVYLHPFLSLYIKKAFGMNLYGGALDSEPRLMLSSVSALGAFTISENLLLCFLDRRRRYCKLWKENVDVYGSGMSVFVNNSSSCLYTITAHACIGEIIILCVVALYHLNQSTYNAKWKGVNIREKRSQIKHAMFWMSNNLARKTEGFGSVFEPWRRVEAFIDETGMMERIRQKGDEGAVILHRPCGGMGPTPRRPSDDEFLSDPPPPFGW